MHSCDRTGHGPDPSDPERIKRIELIEASKEAERQAIGVKVQADAEKLRAEASRVRFEVEAAGQRAVNASANLLSSNQISLQVKLELLKVLPEIIREAAKPIEAIKIVQVDGLTRGSQGEAGGEAHGGSDQNLTNSAVAAALRYRAQAPVIDG